MKLVLAEKPSVARDIAKVLKCSEKGEGCLRGTDYICTWAIGHLVELAEPEAYDDKYKKWSLDTLPIIPNKMKLKPSYKTREQYKIVKRLMTSEEVSEIIVATDAGREGELIFRYIYSISGCKKPFKRLWISSMTDTAIREGFQKLRPGVEYDALYESAKCRSESDWLVGMNASRAFTVKYSELLSIGRVQTPTLAILVQRHHEIAAFIPDDYWLVKAQYEGFTGTWCDIENKESRIFDENKAKEIAAKVNGKTGIIEEVTEESKKDLPPLLYDLTELQRDGNKRYGLSAQNTLTIAQSLYEKHKLITYPRTDSRYLSKDIVPTIPQRMNAVHVEPYSGFIDYLKSAGKLSVSKRIVDDSKVSDHHAIIPTEIKPNLEKLSPDERKIYDLIIRRFISVFYPPFTYLVTSVVVEVEGEHFLSKGKTIQQKGWTLVYEDVNEKRSQKEEKEEEQDLPHCVKGQKVNVKKSVILKKQTKAPSLYTESSLLSAMEHAGRFIEDEELKEQLKGSGLGTPATRAAVIERLIKVGYITRSKKNLLPTEKGISLIQVVPKEIKSPEMTAKWERALNQMAKGQMDSGRFMESIKRYTIYLVENAVKAENVKFPQGPDTTKKSRYGSKGKTQNKDLNIICPVCSKGNIFKNSKGYGCTEWKAGCKFFVGEIYGKNLNEKQVRQLLEKGSTEIIKDFEEKGKDKFQGRVLLKNNRAVVERVFENPNTKTS